MKFTDFVATAFY